MDPKHLNKEKKEKLLSSNINTAKKSGTSINFHVKNPLESINENTIGSVCPSDN